METPTLRDLLAPLSVDEFVDAYRDRRHLHVARGRPDYFESRVACDALTADGLAFEAENPGKLTRLDDHHNHAPELFAICRELGRELGAIVGANVYYARPGGEGIGPHIDSHDVFVMQLRGRKRWRLYEGPVLPPLSLPAFSFESLDVRRPRADFRTAQTVDHGALIADVVVESGDFLYVPRGTFHDVLAIDVDSLHITLGALPVTRIDWLTAAVTAGARADAGLRRGLPIGALEPGPVDPAHRAELAADLRALADALDADLAIGELAQAYVRFRGLAGVRRPPAAIEGWFERVPEAEATLDVTVGRARLTVNGKLVDLPARAAAAVRHVLASTRFTASSLPGDLEDKERIGLLDRLARVGLVRRAA
jgi:hypothetical protein